MKWRRVKNRDVIDVRGARRSGGGGGALPLPGGIKGLGGGAGIIVVLVVIGLQLLGGGSSGCFYVGQICGPAVQAPGANDPQPIPRGEDPQRDLKDFSVYVFEDVQRTWAGTFADAGRSYDHAKLVLYSGAVQTDGCGGATSAVGPFYCPGDKRVYLDLSFYEDMRRELGAPGDFAWAYVIAHEMGHHVQQQLGTSEQVARMERDNPADRNPLSVRLDIQADCYAGVWAHSALADG